MSELIQKLTTQQFGIFYHKTGRLLTLEETSNGEDRYACNETSVKLSDDGTLPEYLVDDLETAVYVFNTDTSWYNSSREHPGHGSINTDDCQVVQVERQLVIRSVTVPTVHNFTSKILCPIDIKDLATLKRSSNYRENLYLGMVIKSSYPISTIKVGDCYLRDYHLEKIVAVFKRGEDVPSGFVQGRLEYFQLSDPNCCLVIGKKK